MRPEAAASPHAPVAGKAPAMDGPRRRRRHQPTARHAMESAASMTGTPRVETLGQLVGQFAHDLNNQLAIALASVELASRLDDRDKVRQLLVRAVEAIERQRVLLE